MLHEPAQKAKFDPATGYKTSLGVKMFFLYCIVYGGFVAINIINPQLMAKFVTADLNLAVVYGFGLIAFAMILAVIYNALCTNKEKALKDVREEK